MRLGSVRPGDVVLVDRGGRQFYAIVVGRVGSLLDVMPIDNRISYRSATAREVIGHWRKAAGSR